MKKIIILTISFLALTHSYSQESKPGFTVNRQSETPIVYEHAYTKPLINETGIIVGRYETRDSNGRFYFHLFYKEKTIVMPALSHFFFSEKNKRIMQLGSSFEKHVQATCIMRMYDLNGQLLSAVEKPYHAPFVGHFADDGSFLLAAQKKNPDSLVYLMKFNKSLMLQWERKFSNCYPQNIMSSPDQSKIIFIAHDYNKLITHTILLSGNGIIRHDITDLNTVNAIEFAGNNKVLMGGGNLVKMYSINENKLIETGFITIPVNVATNYAISISGDGKYFAVSHCHGDDVLGIDVSVYKMSDLARLTTIAVSSDRVFRRYRIMRFSANNQFEIFTPTNIINYEFTTY